MQHIQKLDGDYQHAYLFVLQAQNPEGGQLTRGQLNSAIDAAGATLELLGANVEAHASLIQIETVEEGKSARLVIDVAVEEVE